jgi:transposase
LRWLDHSGTDDPGVLGGASKPWDVDDELWALIEPLLPKVERRIRHPGRKRHPDRLVFQGILFVLHTGIAWEHLPQELGFGSGMTVVALHRVILLGVLREFDSRLGTARLGLVRRPSGWANR